MNLRHLTDRIRFFNRDIEIERTLDAVRRRLESRASVLKKYTARQRAHILAQDAFYKKIDAIRRALDSFDREVR